MKNLFLWLAIGVMAYFGWQFYQKHPKGTTLPTAMESPMPAVAPQTAPPQQEQNAKAEEMFRARVLHQQKIDRIRQQIKEARQAIFENKPGSMGSSPLFGDTSRLPAAARVEIANQQRSFILDKQKEVTDLQNELNKLELSNQ